MSDKVNGSSQIKATQMLEKYLSTDFADEESSQQFFDYFNETIQGADAVDIIHIIATYLHVIKSFVADIDPNELQDRLYNPLYMAAFNGT